MKKKDLYYERIPTKSLREDVRFLGNTLGNVIKEQEGANFYNLVEKIRKSSKANKIQICKRKRFTMSNNNQRVKKTTNRKEREK